MTACQVTAKNEDFIIFECRNQGDVLLSFTLYRANVSIKTLHGVWVDFPAMR